MFVRDNRGSQSSSSYGGVYEINASRNLQVESNRAIRMILDRDTVASIRFNSFYFNQLGCCTYGIIKSLYISSSRYFTISDNSIFNYNWNETRGIDLTSCRDMAVLRNIVDVKTSNSYDEGIYIGGSGSRSISILDNTVYNTTSGYQPTATTYGINVQGGDSVYVRRNNLDGLGFSCPGYGIYMKNVLNVMTSVSVRAYGT